MTQEIEAKFLQVDFDLIREKLKAIGGVCRQHMRMMKRVVLDFPDRDLQANHGAWVRVRDEGNKITLTYKQTVEHQFGGANEIEVTVSSYEDTIAIFQKLGLVIHTDQETKRETWQIGTVEIVLDEWPWLDPYIEIEGPTKDSVQEVAQKLGLDWNDAIFGSITVAYRHQYPKISKEESISQIPQIKFSLPVPDWFTKAAIEPWKNSFHP